MTPARAPRTVALAVLAIALASSTLTQCATSQGAPREQCSAPSDCRQSGTKCLWAIGGCDAGGQCGVVRPCLPGAADLVLCGCRGLPVDFSCISSSAGARATDRRRRCAADAGEAAGTDGMLAGSPSSGYAGFGLAVAAVRRAKEGDTECRQAHPSPACRSAPPTPSPEATHHSAIVAPAVERGDVRRGEVGGPDVQRELRRHTFAVAEEVEDEGVERDVADDVEELVGEAGDGEGGGGGRCDEKGDGAERRDAAEDHGRESAVHAIGHVATDQAIRSRSPRPQGRP